MDNNWFESRGLKVLNYQRDVISKVEDSLTRNEITVLAACPSAGKTLMTIYLIDKYLKQNPSHRVLILTHGTRVLRSQFYNVMLETDQKSKLNFNFDMVYNSTEYINSNASVIIALPQSFHNCDLKQTDLLIVDEAHQFYLAAMVKKIIQNISVFKQLLLTGTPSKLIYENLTDNKYNIIPVTLNTIFDEGMVSEAYVEVASSTYNFDLEDFKDGELAYSTNFDESETNKTLDDLINQIIIRLKSFRGNTFTNVTPDCFSVFNKLQKTMFACKNIKQANQVNNYLVSKGIKTALSTSDDDKESEGIETFKNDDNCLVLIVVYRGILGFNMEKLVNVVDMTTSHNIDRIYQLFSRVIRVNRADITQKKLFFKIAPNMLTDYYKHIMTAVLMLSDEAFFTKYNGKNFNDMEIPVKRIPKPRTKSSDSGDNKPEVKGKKYQPIDMENLPVFEFFKNILHKKDKLLTTYCMTTIRDVRAEFTNRKTNNYWTKERCIEDALKYKTRSEWQKESRSAYKSASINDWLGECTKHMKELLKPKGYWSKELCIKIALKYNKISQWKKGDPKSYVAAQRLGCIFECSEHMKKQNLWTLEKCLEDALKYNTKSEWCKNSNATYQFAIKNKLLEECCKHMMILKKPKNFWTKEKCINDALNYNNKTEWKKQSASSYQIAYKNNWLNDCCQHMKK